MLTRSRVAVLGLVASVGLCAASAPASAAPKPISGTLSKSGYTVIALAADGRASAARAGGRVFRLRPPTGRVTLHLRGPNGKYAGPLVVGRRKRGRLAVVGVRSGARLGRITVLRGYARLSRRPRRSWIDRRRVARARRGVPIGARRFGRVRSRRVRTRVLGDRDLDGVHDLLDIDDDGDLVLDSLDRSGSASAAQEDEFAQELNAFSRLSLSLSQTANANHPALAAQIDNALPSFGDLLIGLNDAPLPGDAELDCASPQDRTDPRLGGLVYCTRGGTGRVSTPVPTPHFEPFPGDPGGRYDPDGDGFGSVISQVGNTCRPGGGCGGMDLRHGARSDQIGTGDLLILRAGDRDRAGMLRFVFATTPALVSYDDDGPGGSDPVPISYPVAPAAPGSSFSSGLPVRPRPDGQVILTLTFWRPQRSSIPGETGQWIDIGGVSYEVQDAQPPHGNCPPTAFSENDPELTHSGGFPGFRDTAPDRPANPGNTFTYTVNLTRCLASSGVASSFDQPGEQHGFSFGGRAPSALDITQQSVSFRRQ
ncbi:MAG TPA: hypothetical protein VHG69_05700 [Thermoleophilaceae bacterium]|nr:hypothetical protein [Thermoleophilaceae bacterium]